jgi:probable phosphoglycerate mutase
VVERLRAASGTALVFGHGHMLRILTARLLGLAAADGRLFIFEPGRISIVSSEHGRPALLTQNSERGLTPT